MKQTAVEWLVGQVERKHDLTQRDIDKAKEIGKEQQDKFTIEFAEWKDINCIYYDGWNIKVPLGDKYSDVYTNQELLEIFKNK